MFRQCIVVSCSCSMCAIVCQRRHDRSCGRHHVSHGCYYSYVASTIVMRHKRSERISQDAMIVRAVVSIISVQVQHVICHDRSCGWQYTQYCIHCRHLWFFWLICTYSPAWIWWMFRMRHRQLFLCWRSTYYLHDRRVLCGSAHGGGGLPAF